MDVCPVRSPRLPGFGPAGLLSVGPDWHRWSLRRLSDSAPWLATVLTVDPVEADWAGVTPRAERAETLRDRHVVEATVHAEPDAIVLLGEMPSGPTLHDLSRAAARWTVGQVVTALAPIALAMARWHGSSLGLPGVDERTIHMRSDGLPVLAAHPDVRPERAVATTHDVDDLLRVVSWALSRASPPTQPEQVVTPDSAAAIAAHLFDLAEPEPWGRLAAPIDVMAEPAAVADMTSGRWAPHAHRPLIGDSGAIAPSFVRGRGRSRKRPLRGDSSAS